MTDVTEREWQQTVVDTLTMLGYLVCHVYPLQTTRGWKTPTTVRGWPDITAVGRGHTLFIEVKGAKTPVTAEQIAVLEILATPECARSWIVRPTDDYNTLANWMARPTTSPRRFGWNETTIESAARNADRRTRRKVNER
jgi:hypothetical protein